MDVFNTKKLDASCLWKRNNLNGAFEKGNPRLKKIRPVYTIPQQRTWVGLTVGEVVEIELATNHPREFAKAIEDKLKEKNT